MLVLSCKPSTAVVLSSPGQPDVTIHFKEKSQIAIDAPLSVLIRRAELIPPSDPSHQPAMESNDCRG